MSCCSYRWQCVCACAGTALISSRHVGISHCIRTLATNTSLVRLILSCKSFGVLHIFGLRAANSLDSAHQIYCQFSPSDPMRLACFCFRLQIRHLPQPSPSSRKVSSRKPLLLIDMQGLPPAHQRYAFCPSYSSIGGTPFICPL